LKCVDTCFVIDLLRGVEEAVAESERLDTEGGAAITAVSVFELWLGLGALRGRRRARAAEQLRAVLDRLYVLKMDAPSAEKAGQIFVETRERGRQIEQNDALIAGICISAGCEALVTRNVGHFEGVRNLKISPY